MNAAKRAVAALVFGVTLAPAMAEADETGTFATVDLVTSLSAGVTMAGTIVAITRKPRPVGALVGLGVADVLVAGVELSWAGYFFHLGSRTCERPSNPLALDFSGLCELGNAFDKMIGLADLVMGVANFGLAIAAFALAGYHHAPPRSSFQALRVIPLTIPAARGSLAPGLGVTAVF